MSELIEKKTNSWQNIGINNMALQPAENENSKNGELLEEDENQPQMFEHYHPRPKYSCCVIPSLILNVILFGAVFILVVVLYKNTPGDGKGQPDLPRSAMQVGEDMKKSKDESGQSALVIDFVVNTNMSTCQHDYCINCTIKINLPREVIDPFDCSEETLPECFSNYGYLKLKEKTKIHCNSNRAETVTCCRKAMVANNENYCNHGGSVCTGNKSPRCLCEPGWTGDTCEQANKIKYACNCYRAIYALKDWATHPWCNGTHTDMPPQCRQLVQKKQCLCRSPNSTAFDVTTNECDR